MRKILQMAMLFMALLVYAPAFSQTTGNIITIKGTVSDGQNVTLPGVTVSLKGSSIAVITDINGHYSINIPASTNSVLHFSFIGMESADITVGNRTNINVLLKSTSNELNDVVVIGYGTQKRADVNGAISSVTAKDIQDIPQPSVDQMLQGKAAGVTVTQNSGAPGSATSVHIRGITSFGTSEPLYVIDGVAIDGNAANAIGGSGIQLTSQASPSQQETSPSPLAQLNPNDVESIDILKDASATAIYGSRGANGVVIITTKKGKAGNAKIDYDFYYGDQSQGKFLKMMSLPQYAAFENTLADEFGLGRRVEFSNPSALGPGTNWQQAIFKNAPMQSHTLSISGANDKTDYYISGGYYDQQGTIIGSSFNRYTFHTTVNSQVKDWFKIGTSISANHSFENIGLGNSGGLVYNALLAAPDQAVYNADGSYAGPAVVDGTIEGGRNPIQQALNITNTLGRSNVQGNFHGDILFTKDISLHSEIDGNFDWNDAKTFLPTYSYGATGSSVAFVNTQAQLNEYDSNDTYWNWVEHLNYNHTFGKSVVSALVGHEVWESTYDGIQAGTKGFTAGNTIQTLGLGTQTTNTLGEPKGSTTMESFLARVIYTYDDKYSITASDRSDRSSNFAEGHQTGYFPGVAVSWRLSQESFMTDVDKAVSNLKIRLGYGTTGNSNIPGYRYGTAITPVVTGLGTGFSFYNFSNPNLTWETAKQANIGIDFSLFNNRIDASIDAYDKRANNFLFQKPLPAFLGGATAEYSNAAVVQSPYVNAGEIENKGIELNITSRNIVTKDFKWTTNVIFSHYNNKILSLDGAPPIVGNVATGFGPQIPATLSQVGGSVGEFYGYKVEGIIKTQAQLQYLAAHPQNVTGTASVVTSDRTVSNGVYLGDIEYYGETNNGNSPNKQYDLGSPNPDFTYSITNTFSYKDFDLSIFLNGSYGGKVLNALAFQTEGEYGLYMNQTASTANFWTPSNPNSNIPTPRSGFGNNNLVMSDRFLESASFLRLQNVRIGYNLPSRWAKYIKMSHLKFFVSGQNLYVFTKYSGLDPEVGSLDQNPTLQNIDYGRYPTPRVITGGVNAEF
jgi:TonB-linked SusC/RagA family outer membrane protein